MTPSQSLVVTEAIFRRDHADAEALIRKACKGGYVDGLGRFQVEVFEGILSNEPYRKFQVELTLSTLRAYGIE